MRWCVALFSLLLFVPVGQKPLLLLGDMEPGWDEVWRTQQLGGREASYRRVLDEQGDPVLRVDSDGAATALYRRVEGGGAATRIEWRWRVERSLPGTVDETERAGDDYAARLFVIFGDGELRADTRALCYVWAGAQEVGSSYRSPYVEGVHTIVVRRGDRLAGVWVAEERDFVADYRRAFGGEPDDVGAIALLVDTDDTGTRATAWYDDIVLR